MNVCITFSCLTLLLYRHRNQERAVCHDFRFTLKPTGCFDGSQGGPNTLHMSFASPRSCDLKKTLSRPHVTRQFTLKPDRLSNPLKQRRCARCLPILCVCLTIYLIFAEWLRSCLTCGPLRVPNFCSPLPRHLRVFDCCPWC